MRTMGKPAVHVLSIEPLVLQRFGIQEDVTSAAPVVQAVRRVPPFTTVLRAFSPTERPTDYGINHERSHSAPAARCVD